MAAAGADIERDDEPHGGLVANGEIALGVILGVGTARGQGRHFVECL